MPLDAEPLERLFAYCSMFGVSRETFDSQIANAQLKAEERHSLARKSLYQWIALLDPKVSHCCSARRVVLSYF